MSAVRNLRRRPLGALAAGFLTVLLLACIGAAWFAPDDPEEQDLAHALAGPGATHWLGTDRLGRDVLSRLLYGGRVTLLSVVEAVLVFAVVGLTLGLLAGYAGGWVDRAVGWVSDLLLALPGIIILLMVLSVFPGNSTATMVVLGLISAPMLLRVTRGLTMAVRQELYVRAARVSGLSGPRIVWRHVLPRLTGPILVQVFLFSATVVLIQGALSFLGLSTPETQGPSWGNMVGEASQVIGQDSWLAIPTGGAILLTVLALGLLGDAVRDAAADRSRPLVMARPVRRTTAPPVADEPGRGVLLSVRGLTVTFDRNQGPVTAVTDVSFDVAAGECVGIVGESGSGKTVTARSLLGLLPPAGRITAGSARFDGLELTTLTEAGFAAVRGRRIGLVSQEPMAGLDPCFRVGAQLVEVIRAHQRIGRREAGQRAIELLRTVRLPEPELVARRYPHELSGGMAQRVSIALALAVRPELLIADEPTTALDVTVQAEILQLLRDLREQFAMAIILVTHDWGVLADLCDRAVVMYAGEVVEESTVDCLYRTPKHPYTQRLLEANPHLAPVGPALPTIGGSVPAPSAWPSGCRFAPRCHYAVDACRAAPVAIREVDGGRLTRCIRADKLSPIRTDERPVTV